MRIDQPAQENNHKTRNDQSKHDKKTGAQFHEKRSFPGECIMQSVPVKILAAMRAVGRKVAAEQKCTAMRAADANDAPDHAAQRQQGADRNQHGKRWPKLAEQGDQYPRGECPAHDEKTMLERHKQPSH